MEILGYEFYNLCGFSECIQLFCKKSHNFKTFFHIIQWWQPERISQWTKNTRMSGWKTVRIKGVRISGLYNPLLYPIYKLVITNPFDPNHHFSPITEPSGRETPQDSRFLATMSLSCAAWRWAVAFSVHSCAILIYGTGIYGRFLKWWVSPTNPWVFFLLKIVIILGWRLGVPPFKETPIYLHEWFISMVNVR